MSESEVILFRRNERQRFYFHRTGFEKVLIDLLATNGEKVRLFVALYPKIIGDKEIWRLKAGQEDDWAVTMDEWPTRPQITLDYPRVHRLVLEAIWLKTYTESEATSKNSTD